MLGSTKPLAYFVRRNAFLQYSLKYMLYQPRPGGAKASTPLQAAIAAMASAAAALAPPVAAPDAAACPGLSLTDMRAVEEKGGAVPEVSPLCHYIPHAGIQRKGREMHSFVFLHRGLGGPTSSTPRTGPELSVC